MSTGNRINDMQRRCKTSINSFDTANRQPMLPISIFDLGQYIRHSGCTGTLAVLECGNGRRGEGTGRVLVVIACQLPSAASGSIASFARRFSVSNCYGRIISRFRLDKPSSGFQTTSDSLRQGRLRRAQSAEATGWSFQRLRMGLAES